MLQWYIVTLVWIDDSGQHQRHVDGVYASCLGRAMDIAIERDITLGLCGKNATFGVQGCYTKKLAKQAFRLHEINNDAFVSQWSRTEFIEFMCIPASS